MHTIITLLGTVGDGSAAGLIDMDNLVQTLLAGGGTGAVVVGFMWVVLRRAWAREDRREKESEDRMSTALTAFREEQSDARESMDSALKSVMQKFSDELERARTHHDSSLTRTMDSFERQMASMHKRNEQLVDRMALVLGEIRDRRGPMTA